MSKKEYYKTLIINKRLEAGNFMTEEQLESCNIAIHTASVASAMVGGFPIPFVDAIPISAAQIIMVITLGNVFDQSLTQVTAKGVVSAAASTYIGRNLVKFIPFVGWFVSAGVAALITELVGWTVAVNFAKEYRNEYKRKRDALNLARANAEVELLKMRYDWTNEEAENFGEQMKDDDENIE